MLNIGRSANYFWLNCTCRVVLAVAHSILRSQQGLHQRQVLFGFNSISDYSIFHLCLEDTESITEVSLVARDAINTPSTCSGRPQASLLCSASIEVRNSACSPDRTEVAGMKVCRLTVAGLVGVYGDENITCRN